jgi:hypothetical protein
MAIRVVFISGFLGDFKAKKAIKAAVKFTNDSIASDKRPTELVRK